MGTKKNLHKTHTHFQRLVSQDLQLCKITFEQNEWRELTVSAVLLGNAVFVCAVVFGSDGR